VTPTKTDPPIGGDVQQVLSCQSSRLVVPQASRTLWVIDVAQLGGPKYNLPDASNA
jgi:hypothetical protein